MHLVDDQTGVRVHAAVIGIRADHILHGAFVGDIEHDDSHAIPTLGQPVRREIAGGE
jgi:hypothetical protein